MKNRRVRRNQEFKKKKQAKKILKTSWKYQESLITDKNIGKTASTHGKPCSCHMCGNPRKYFKTKTKQEIIEDQKSLNDCD